MSVGDAFEFPADKQDARKRMIRLCQLSCIGLASGAVALFATVGNSQSMKTAWMTDLLTALPPLSLLVALRYELRPPTKRFPYGYMRATSVAFLVTASVLTMFGLFLAFDSGLKLLHRDHPVIGTRVLFGHELWAGWLMIAALAYSMTIGIILGRTKLPVAKALHSKALSADATSNSAEWMSEGAAILGLTLVGFGFWWGDAAAAFFISIEVIRDGWTCIKLVLADLMDESPSKLDDDELETLPVRLQRTAEGLDWVKRAAVRLREHGHAVTGEVFLVPRDPEGALERLTEAGEKLRATDWRLHDLVVVLTPEIADVEPPRLAGVSGA